jgi:hypothetical protein
VPGPNGAIVFVRNAVKGPAVAPPDLGTGDRAKTGAKADVADADASDSEPGASVSEAGVGSSEETGEEGTPPSSERPVEAEVTSEA